MKLSLNGLKDRKFWESAGISLPVFDIEKTKHETLKEPAWLHFGAGNIFRAFPCVMQQDLLNKNLTDKGIVVCETYDEEIVEKAFKPYDNLTISVTLTSTGEMQKLVVASVVDAITLSGAYKKLEQIFSNKSLQVVSMTITEKGYALYGSGGDLLPFIAADMDNKPTDAKSMMGILAAMCYVRYKNGGFPVALLSMDNCSHNGDKVFEAVSAFADAWAKKGFVEKGFCDYIRDSSKVSFPLSMIDKITPHPSEKVQAALAAAGIEDMDTVRTAKNTYVAPFVNAEETQYLIVEDKFPNGRPPLEKAGVIFTDRDTVDKVEKMKVCTCLNPLHTTLAVFGVLLSYKTIADEMKDKDLPTLIKRLGYDEGMPVVVNPGIIDPAKFIDEVITKRFPNPFVPDTPQRIAIDISQKIPVRFGETLKIYAAKGMPVSELTYIPLFAAGWLRYLLGVDDNGNAFEISPDPMLDTLKKYLDGIKLGDTEIGDKVRPILSDKKIFGIDLYEHGLGEKVESYFKEMLTGTSAVRKTLERVLGS